MNKFYIIICLILISLSVAAQPKMEVEHNSLDFGNILWNTPTMATFQVKNVGDSPLYFTEVTSSCACTTVDWPRRGLQVGETGAIQAIFDAKTLGTFFKEMEIRTNATEEPVYLQFTGRVVPNASDVTITEGFETKMGDVRISKDALEFDQVVKGTNPVQEILVLNPSMAAFEPVLMHIPEYLEVSYYPERIPVGKTGRIRIKLLSDKLPGMGLTQTSVYFARSFGDKVSADNEIPVSAILLPDFSDLSPASKKNAPKMQLSSNDIHIQLKGKVKGKTTVLLTNTGKQVLKINRLQVLSPAVNVSLPSKSIAIGQTVKMKISIDTTKIKKNRKPGILMITNDPENPEQVIHLTLE